MKTLAISLGPMRARSREEIGDAVCTWLLTVLLLWALGFILVKLHPWREPDLSSKDQLVPWAAQALAPEPGERTLYVLLVLASPLGVFVAHRMTRRVRHHWLAGQEAACSRHYLGALGAAALAVGWILVAAHRLEVFQDAFGSGTMPLTLGLAGLLLSAISLQDRFLSVAARKEKWVRRSALGAALLLAIWASVAGRVFGFAALSQINWDHFNAILYPVAQRVAGQHRHAVLLDPPHALFDADGACVSYPFDWRLFQLAGDFSIEMIFTPAAVEVLTPLCSPIIREPISAVSGFKAAGRRMKYSVTSGREIPS